jgi:hypothetical protein
MATSFWVTHGDGDDQHHGFRPMPCLRLNVPTIGAAPDGDRIRGALLREPGVYEAQANCREKLVEIDFEDDEVTLERLWCT